MRCRHCRDAEACACVEADFFWQNDGLGCWEDNKFGSRAKRALPLAIPYPDPLANPRFRDTVTDLIDYAGAVAMRYDPWVSDFSCGTLP